MSGMFSGCRLFNGDLSHWKTGCVTDMNGMFRNCLSFNGDLSRWATGNVVSICGMFFCCTSFQGGDLRSWDTRRVINMSSAFNGCTVFNGDLRTWITGGVLYMYRMFEGCRSFNGDLRRWDTSKVTYAMEMFFGCVSFRGDLSSWDIGSLYPYDSEEEDFGIIIDRICGGLGSVIPQDFRPSRRWNRLRNGEPWRPSDYEEERMRNIARNQEMLRKLRLEPYEGNYPSPATKVNCEPLRKSDKIHGDLQVSRPSPGSYEEERNCITS